MLSSTATRLSTFLLLFPPIVHSFSWNFKSPPKQCSDLTVSVSGSDGKPPYRVLVIPFGSSPFTNNTEVRRIVDQDFGGNDKTEVTFKLNFPAFSQLVAIVSDSSGFGSGGTSVAAQVIDSDDRSCYDASKNVAPQWGFSITPEVTQCVESRVSWEKDAGVQGDPTFYGIIPGGQSFKVPVSGVTDQTSAGKGIGFQWKPSVRGGTQLIIVAGDNRGTGNGGSTSPTVANGANNIGDCLNAQSPSSTPGTPAGGSYPTSSSQASNDGNGGNSGSNDDKKSTPTAAIVGGVVGGVVALLAILLLLLFLRRRKRLHNRKSGTQPVDLLHSDEADGDDARQTRNELPQYYQPEPFIVPDPSRTSASTDLDGPLMGERRMSLLSSTDRSGTPDLLSASGTSATGRKGGAPRSLRPVNIIQHDDAGPSGPGVKEEEAETIELPPAYTNIKPATRPTTTTTNAPAETPPAAA